MNTEEIDWVCDSCGIKYGKWYQANARAPKTHYATYHTGTCDVCKTEGDPVTEPRDFGYLITSRS